jgi:Gram-negative bacterial TonB protein C-terminal
MRKAIVAALVLAGCLTATAAAAQPNPLVAARDLYASARYDEALAMLNGIRPADSDNGSEMKFVEQYRSLCLLALGRGSEAEKAIAAVVTADPSYQPDESEASPRVRAAFSEVRRRMLPQLVASRYSIAKATFDRKEFASAEGQFRELLALLDDPDMGGKLADLRTLVAGFVDLSAAAAAPAPAPAPEPKAAAPAPQPVAPVAQPTSPPPLRIYSSDEPGIVLPTVIKQEVPQVPAQVLSQTRDRGLLEVVIDEQGRVTNLALRVSMHPIYDTLLLTAAREWRYQPATLNGRPVKFRKMMQITVSKR